jgi:hypothetical protein
MKKALFYFLLIAVFGLLFVSKALAVCPLCTVTVGVGVGFSRWLGIDDIITGLWIGGLIASLITWTESWLKGKNIHFRGRLFIIILGYYLLMVLPLYFTGFLSNPQSSFAYIYGIYFDKLLLGIIVGSFAFWFGASWYYCLKEKNQGRVYFPFQKVVMPVAPLIFLSIIFYFLTR